MSTLGKRKHKLRLNVPPSLTLYLVEKQALKFSEFKDQIMDYFTEISFDRDFDNQKDGDNSPDSCSDSDSTYNGQNPFYVDGVIEELFRYLYLLAHYPVETIQISPSEVVDQALHLLLLNPILYYKVCDELLTLAHQDSTVRPFRLLPHNPRGGIDQVQRAIRYRQTLEDYTAHFANTPPANIWPQHVSLQKLVDSPQVFSEGDTLMQIFVRTDKTITLAISKQHGTVSAFKILIQAATGISPAAQILIFGCSQLESDRLLSEYGIKENSTIQLHLRLRGC